jgi:hypothetical protein
MIRPRKFSFPNWLVNSFIFLIGTGVFIFILVNRSPFPLRPMALQARTGLTLFAPIALIAFFLIFRLKGFWGGLLSFTLIMGLFSLALSGLWASGSTEPQVISGLLPTTDAGGYYYDALRLLNGARFSDFSSRRPIFAALISFILFITGKNLQATNALLVGIVGITCYFATRQTRKIWTPLSASIFLLFIFFFIRRYTGKIMTENLGLAFGLLGFAFFINGVMRKDKVILSISLLLLTLGLNVRAGPYFILIGFFIAANLLFKEERKWDKRFALILILVIILGFLVNYAVFQIIGSKSGLPFSNFSYSLYGLVNNGGGWTKISADHPEIFSLPEPQLSNRIYQLAFESFKANPFGIVIGALREYGVLFNFIDSNQSIYSFVFGENFLIFHLTQVFIYIFAIIGLVTIIKKRKQPFNYFLLFILAGFFLSIPFSPPGDSSNMRVFAVAIPFIICLPVIGVEKVTKKITWLSNKEETENGIRYPKSELVVTSLLMIASIIAPIIIHSFSHMFNRKPIQCNPGQDLVYMDLRPGTSIQVLPESEFFLDWMPNFHHGRFTINLHAMSVGTVIEEFELLSIPVMITSGINLADNQDLFLIIQDRNKFDLLGRYAICGKWSDAPTILGYSPFFYAENFTIYPN